MEGRLVRVWLGKGEHRAKMKLVVLFCALGSAHGQRGRNLQAEGDQPSWDVSASKEKAE